MDTFKEPYNTIWKEVIRKDNTASMRTLSGEPPPAPDPCPWGINTVRKIPITSTLRSAGSDPITTVLQVNAMRSAPSPSSGRLSRQVTPSTSSSRRPQPGGEKLRSSASWGNLDEIPMPQSEMRSTLSRSWSLASSYRDNTQSPENVQAPYQSGKRSGRVARGRSSKTSSFSAPLGYSAVSAPFAAMRTLPGSTR
eukprot:TRINITY_DN24250_c0_g1_i1.p1 TRINITY_DN24250_c0_g1~~TRINITY_DN24250_c0_g1_i1.p1  ORF type:complete len:195 (+),score=9.57 TRINITY_DN24250_c0_g1_i1:87-671(+)